MGGDDSQKLLPAPALRGMGATHVISVHLPCPESVVDPGSMLSVINRCFQILTGRTEAEWRRASSLVITPDVASVGWDSFSSYTDLICAGERAAMAALPRVRRWLDGTLPAGVSVTTATAQAILPYRSDLPACGG